MLNNADEYQELTHDQIIARIQHFNLWVKQFKKEIQEETTVITENDLSDDLAQKIMSDILCEVIETHTTLFDSIIYGGAL